MQAVPAVLVAHYFAGALQTFVTQWMDHCRPLSEREMERHFHRLIAGVGR